jgi:hypothetical protein
METYERPTLRNVHFANEMDFKTFRGYTPNCKNDDERREKFDKMKNYCQSMIKAKGEIKKTFAYTEVTPILVGGRLYCSFSAQSLQKDIRGLFFRDCTTDIDMKNSQPTILRYLCKIHNIPCPNLSWYVEHRDEVLEALGSNGKKLILCAMNDNKLNPTVSSRFFKDFDKECKAIQNNIVNQECYSHIIDTVPSNKLYNYYGSGMNRILSVFENKILQEALSVINKHRIEVCSPFFDGALLYGNHYDNEALLNEVNTHVNTVYEGLNMVFTYKEQSQLIQVPEDYVVKKEAKELTLTRSFQTVSEEFERNHCKITNTGFFIKHTPENIVVMKKAHLITAYEDITYQKIVKDEIVECNFINDWLKNNPKQLKYEDIGCFPDVSACPENTFNTWRPFAMELVKEYTKNQEALDMMLNHIKVLCNHDEVVASYMEKWIAQMIQFPAIKSNCPTIISKQGAGKGTFLTLISLMIGKEKYFETTNPLRDVWGDFNSRMSRSYLVNMDELSRKDSLECDGKIKGLISNPILTINQKGVDPYPIISYHRFIGTTNNEDPIKTSKDDRRNWIIRASDELIGDVKYFNKMQEYLADVNVIKTCYEYFKSIPDIKDFKSIPMPVTEYQKEMKEISMSPIESWVKAYTLEHYCEEKPIELLGKKQYQLFTEWCKKCNIDYKVTIQAFGVRLMRLKIVGIKKGKHTMFGQTNIFEIKILRQYFHLDDEPIAEPPEEVTDNELDEK